MDKNCAALLELQAIRGRQKVGMVSLSRLAADVLIEEGDDAGVALRCSLH